MADIAHQLAQPILHVEDALRRLAAAKVIALAPGSLHIWMAHPFSALPTAYPVRTADQVYWANCAWDALGIPALLGVDSETTTHCPASGTPLSMQVKGGEAYSTAGVIHFAVPPRRFWDDIGFT